MEKSNAEKESSRPSRHLDELFWSNAIRILNRFTWLFQSTMNKYLLPFTPFCLNQGPGLVRMPNSLRAQSSGENIMYVMCA